MRTAEEILRKFVTIHTFGDVNATKASILQAMEEYANECVKAKCTIPVVSTSAICQGCGEIIQTSYCQRCQHLLES